MRSTRHHIAIFGGLFNLTAQLHISVLDRRMVLGVRAAPEVRRHLHCQRSSFVSRKTCIRVRVDIIGHARIKFACKYQSCMVSNGRLIPHAS